MVAGCLVTKRRVDGWRLEDCGVSELWVDVVVRLLWGVGGGDSCLLTTIEIGP